MDNSYSGLQTQTDFQLFFHTADKQRGICLCSQATHTEAVKQGQITWIGLSVRIQGSKKLLSCHLGQVHAIPFWTSNFSFSLALWEGIRHVGLSTKSLQQQTKTRPGKAKCQSYVSQGQAQTEVFSSSGGCSLISTDSIMLTQQPGTFISLQINDIQRGLLRVKLRIFFSNGLIQIRI